VTVTFQNPTPSFNFYWGPISAASTGAFDDVLIVNGDQFVTGTELVAAGSALAPQVNGNTPTLPNDNQWFNISDDEGQFSSSPRPRRSTPRFLLTWRPSPSPRLGR
jgi:hypothetical protein